jgi:hypothetical protein
VHAVEATAHTTALHNAISPVVCRALLDAGAAVNARDLTGRTPLHVFCGAAPDPAWHGGEALGWSPGCRDETARCAAVLERGADTAAVDGDGLTPRERFDRSAATFPPLDDAARRMRAALRQLLLDWEAKGRA